MNAFAERFVRSIKSECLDQMIFVGQPSLEQAIREFVEHYHEERPHQGLGNDLIRGAPAVRAESVRCDLGLVVRNPATWSTTLPTSMTL